MKHIILVFTELELAGLSAIASEGAEGLLTDAAASRAYIGDRHAVAAAKRALKQVTITAARNPPINKHKS